MSMPSYWFDPMAGGGGGVLGGNAATGQPALSSAQINASMGWNPNASFNPWANTPGGFGGQTAAYSALGAAYGRQVPQSSPAAVAAAGGQADRLRALYPGAFSGGGIGSDAARAPSQPAIQPAAPEQPDFNDLWSGRGAQSLARDNLFNDYSGMMNPQPQAPTGLSALYNGMGLPQPWTSPMSPNAGAGWGGFDSGMGLKSGGGGQADRLRALYPAAFSGGSAYATGTPAGTRAAVPNVGSYMPSGQFGGENTNTFGMNLPNYNLGATGIRADPFGGYVSSAYRGLQGWPQAQDIANSPLAGYGGINNRFGGMQEPVWSPAGITLGDKLRSGASGNTLLPSDQVGPGNPFGMNPNPGS